MLENPKIKYFISTGCSFTDVPISSLQKLRYVDLDQCKDYNLSWPVHVNNHLGSIPQYKGKGCAGNGIISRTTVYEVNKALQEYKVDEILVGIMWSGYYRQELYFTEPQMDYYSMNSNLNPTSIGEENNFYRVMPYWDDELSKFYYKHIYDEIGAYILTLENILRTQWYLQCKNIKYFMSTYYPSVFPIKEHLDNPNIKYLYDMIDFSYFLPVESEWNWCCEYQDPSTWYPDESNKGNPHPNTLQHKAFADKVIIPFLKHRGWI